MKYTLDDMEKTNIRTGLMVRLWGILPYGVVIFLLVLILILGAAYSGKKSRLEAANTAAEPAQELINVVALTLNPTSIRDRITLPATVEPWVRLTLTSEVRGKVVQKVAEEGTQVKKGDLVAVIDCRDYENDYNSAKAQYDTAKASHDRYAELYKEQLATKSQLDSALAAMENTRSAMDTAALSVERCRIVAPFSGALNNIYFELGQYINPGDAMAELLQVDRLKVNVGIPESDVEAVRKLSEFDITFDSLNGKTVRGTSLFLSRTTDSSARVYSLKLAVNNPDRDILPDMFARVDIVKREIEGGIAIPLYSIITRNEKNYAYVLKGDTVELRTIETGLQESWMVEVKNGLALGEKVIVTGHRNLEEGQKVNVMQTLDKVEVAQQ